MAVEYIKREDAINTAIWSADEYWDQVKKALEAVPAADVVERKRGVWLTGLIKDSSGSVRKTFSFCSLCSMSSDKGTRFCSNCGAQMESADDVLRTD